MSAFPPNIGTEAPAVNTAGAPALNTAGDVFTLQQEAAPAPKKAKKVKPYHSMQVYLPRSAYTLNYIGFYRAVALYRLRRNKKNDVFLSEADLMKATNVDRANRLEALVWQPLAKFIVAKKRTHQGGVPCWRIVLVDPNPKPDGWQEGDGKWFLRVPCWWLWAPETAHNGDRWVPAQDWNARGPALKAAVSLQIADETRGKGQTEGKNITYFAKVLGVSNKSASDALTTASDLGWLGTGNRTGGNGVKAHRWTRWMPTDRTSDKNPRWAAGHTSRHHKPTQSPVFDLTAPLDPDVDPHDAWGLGMPVDDYSTVAIPAQRDAELVTAGNTEPPW